MTDVFVDIDGYNKNVLYNRRLEAFFEPNEDGTESLNGRVIWHTEWWHYSGALLRGKSIGPRIERSIDAVLGEEYPVGAGALSAPTVVAALKSAFIKHALQENLGLVTPENPDAD